MTSTFNIAGIPVHTYTSSDIQSYVSNSPNNRDVPINVVYLLHGRTKTYQQVVPVAQRMVDELKGDVPTIVVAFDLRNHGHRLVDESANQAWPENKNHALDMTAQIDGNVADLKTIVENLPVYLGLHKHLPTPNVSTVEYKVVYRNTLVGFSLGGHTVIRFASRHPELVDHIVPVVGCADLSTLLVNRLRKEDDYSRKLFYFSYAELNLTPEEQQLYPRELHDKVSAEDSAIFETFPIGKVHMLAVFGGRDNEVPPQISKLWADMCSNSDEKSGVVVAEERGHELADDMVERIISYLSER